MPDNPQPTLDPTSLPGFQTAVVQPWLQGVQLNKPVDRLTPQEASRLSNLVHTGGALSVRPGMTAQIAGLGGSVNAIRRLSDPQNGLSRVFWGAGSTWYRADSDGGNPQLLESGFSGDPLTFVPIRKPQESGAWMLVADRLKMRKAGMATTPSTPLGLAAPGTAVVSQTAITFKAFAAAFDASDSTQAANWTPIASVDDDGITAGVPTLANVVGTDGNAVAMTVVPGSSGKGFRSCMAIAKALNLSTFFTGGAVENEDFFHLQLRLSDPSNIKEVRIYFICGPTSLTATIPGTGLTENTAAYMHAFQPSDYESFIGVQQGGNEAAFAAAGNSIVGATPIGKGRIRPPGAPTTGVAIPRAGEPTTQAAGGANTWLEFTQVGLPLRRSDFTSIGTAGDPGTDWSTISGIYIVVWTRINRALTVSFDDAYFTGGAGLDTSEPGSQKYDYRYIHFDTRTGARSNGSPEQAITSWLDSLRQPAQLQPVANGNPFVRQEFFRRGGSITDNWYFVGVNTSDGGVFTDTLADADILASDTLPTENFQPVATVDGNGNTVLAQPVPIVFGPIGDGIYCALGDPYRPGHVYSCLAGNFDAWPSTGSYIVEVCSPTEELMNGCVLGGGGFVLSRERGYTIFANPGGVGIVYQPTDCTPGLAARWGFCTGPGGIFYVARDAVRVTGGGASQVLSDQIQPLFNGQTVNDRLPIDFSQPTEIGLECHNFDLWLTYKDTAGNRQKAVYSLLWKYWRFVDFQSAVTMAVYSDETRNVQGALGPNRLLLGTPTGLIARHDGFTDLGISIPATLRTGAETYGQARQDKLLGDLAVDADGQGAGLVVRTFFNAETVISGNVVIPATTGRRFNLLQPFGPEPERARSLSVDITLTAPANGSPVLYGIGAAVALQPEVTLARVTDWEPLPGPEAYLQGLRIDCDTFGLAKTVLVEAELNGVVSTVATLTIQTLQGSGPTTRHTQWYSWPAVHANNVRLRPLDTNRWTLWRADWLSSAEPARIAVWDTNWENLGADRYYTGVDLEVDTFGVAKTLQVWVDQLLLTTLTVTAAGRRYLHFDLPIGRGHLFRLVATDAAPGLFYRHEWLTTEEPREQANWNAQFTTWSSLSDKYLKGLVIECDTFGLTKLVDVEADGVVVQQISVNHTGRKVKNYTFPQVKGRVFRVLPEDSHPSRPYSILPLFDEEPYALSRWETQLLDFDLPGSGWGSVLTGDFCYQSTVDATLTVACYNAEGTLVTTLSAALPSTAGAKQKVYRPFDANKGVLFKLIFQTDDDTPNLTLYQEESRLRILPWASGEAVWRQFGNSDNDRTRNMVSSVGAAQRSGGGT